MSHVYKMIEVVGSSTISSDNAIRNAIAAVGVSVNKLRWYQVVEHRGHIEDGEITHFQVTVKVGFQAEEDIK